MRAKRATSPRDKIISFKRTFATPQGKLVLFDLMNRFHVLNTHKGDAFAEGQRAAVLYILQQCHINLEEFDEMLKGDDE